MIDIRNESCLKTMKELPPNSIDVVLTSPFYNTNKKAGKGRTLENTTARGAVHPRFDTTRTLTI